MRLAAAILCAGCGYHPGVATPDSEIPADTSTVLPDTGDAPAPDAPLMAVSCDTPAPISLVACYQFDGDLGVLDDSSPNDLDDPTVPGLTAVTRTVNGVSSQAAMIGATVDAHIPQDPKVEITGDYTIVAWLMPIAPSAANNDGIVDHNGQWAFSIENQLITCWWSRSGLTKSTIAIAGEVWQFAACVVSGTTGCVHRIDTNGALMKSCRTDLTGAAPAGNSGYSVGSFEANGGTIEQRFRGAIDDVRIYRRALSDDELCTVAGVTCP